MAKVLHRIQYACNLPATLLPKHASEYLTPCAPTLLVLGHMMYPDFFEWCAKRWKHVVYTPFGVQGPGTESIFQHAALLQPPQRLAYFLPQENVAFVLTGNRNRNYETYQYWTYRGASVVFVSKNPLVSLHGTAPAAHVFANSPAAVNSVLHNTLSVSNPAMLLGKGRVSNYDTGAFIEIQTKPEQGCENNPDVAWAGAALYPAETNIYDPLK
jgi:hypothetical protein